METSLCVLLLCIKDYSALIKHTQEWQCLPTFGLLLNTLIRTNNLKIDVCHGE